MRKVLIGVAIGIMLTALSSLLYSTYMLKNYALNAPRLMPVRDTLANYSTLQQGMNDLKLEHSNFVERIVATNKRVDDILVFGGIIVTLLLGIIVGVYIKAESEVERHFKDNFETYAKRINDLVKDAEASVASAKSNSDITQKLRELAENSPVPPTE